VKREGEVQKGGIRAATRPVKVVKPPKKKKKAVLIVCPKGREAAPHCGSIERKKRRRARTVVAAASESGKPGEKKTAWVLRWLRNREFFVALMKSEKKKKGRGRGRRVTLNRAVQHTNHKRGRKRGGLQPFLFIISGGGVGTSSP